MILRTYVERCLAPTLRPGDIVIMDGLSSHKVDSIAEAIEARGATLHYLPPNSPHLYLIEQAFAKLKALFTKAAVRSVETLWRTISRLVERFMPEECRNYLANTGSASGQYENCPNAPSRLLAGCCALRFAPEAQNPARAQSHA